VPSAHKCPSRARERRCEAQVLCLACCDRHLACTSSSPQVYMCRVVASMVVNAGDWRVSAEGMCTCTPRRPTPLLQQRPTNGFAAMSVAASAEMSAMGLRVVLVAWVWRRLRNGPIAACLEGMLSSGLLIPGQSTTLVQKAGRWIKTLAARRITKSKPSFAGDRCFGARIARQACHGKRITDRAEHTRSDQKDALARYRSDHINEIFDNDIRLQSWWSAWYICTKIRFRLPRRARLEMASPDTSD